MRLAAACDASTCHAFSDRAVGEIPTANEPPNAPVAGGEKGTQGQGGKGREGATWILLGEFIVIFPTRTP